MTAKKNPAPSAVATRTNTGGAVDDRRVRQHNGKALLDPGAHATVLTFTFNDTGHEISLPSMYNEINRVIGLSAKAKLAHIESMLTAQALALQSMFSCLAMRADKTTLIDHFGIYAGLALKAQRQCRATLATLAEIINPARATFIKNNARNQQVNIGEAGVPRLPKKNSRKSGNELLRRLPHAAMEQGRTLATIQTDSPMAAVVQIDRANHAGRKVKSQPELQKARALRS